MSALYQHYSCKKDDEFSPHIISLSLGVSLQGSWNPYHISHRNKSSADMECKQSKETFSYIRYLKLPDNHGNWSCYLHHTKLNVIVNGDKSEINIFLFLLRKCYRIWLVSFNGYILCEMNNITTNLHPLWYFYTCKFNSTGIQEFILSSSHKNSFSTLPHNSSTPPPHPPIEHPNSSQITKTQTWREVRLW